MPDTGLQSPTTNGDDYTDWDNPANGYSSNDVDTWPAGAADQHDWYTFGLSITAGSTIDGIEVLVEGAKSSPGGTTRDIVELSWDGGANYTTSGYTVTFPNVTDTTQTAGGAADLWGRSWAVGEFSDANFRVRLTNDGSKREDIDHIQVRITYTEAAARRIFITHA